jgi:hypothetical protein
MHREARAWEIDAQFREGFQVEWRAPAAESDLVAIEAVMNTALPAGVRGWYEAADGGVARAPGSELSLHSLAEVKEWFEHSPLAKRGHFPFASNNDSNPFCVCCKGPLSSYVIQTPHDDEPRLMYRSTDGFFHAAAAQLASEQSFDPDDLPRDFDAPERTDSDVQAARELVGQVQAGKLKNNGATIALLFAADLLRDAAEIRALSQLGDEYVEQHVKQRLKRLGTDEALRELGTMQQVFDDFVEACATQLRAAGFDATVYTPYESKSVIVSPYDIGLNMEMFFAKRQEPNSEQFLLERVRALIAKHTAKGSGATR